MLKMNGPSLSKAWFCVAALAVLPALWPLSDALAQDQSPTPSTSRGENFSAKPPAQLFASDCTGAGCHKSPQGLSRGQFSGSLANFLREHYTNSRESAAALAGYLSNIPRGAAAAPEPRAPRSGRPAATANAPASALPNWGEGAESKPGEVRPPRPIPGGRTSRAAARPDDDPATPSPAPPVAAPPAAESHPSARAPRGRHPAATAATAAAPAPPPAPEPEAAPAPPPPPPPPKQFDIFD